MSVSKHNKIVSVFIATVAVFCTVRAESVLPSKIVVIKDSQTSFVTSDSMGKQLISRTIDLEIYDIDAVDRFEFEINKQLPGDEVKAKLAFDEYLNRMGRKAFEKEAVQAYQGIMTIVRYDLKKYPAIIFDNSSVIYGVTDLDEALSRYQQWKAALEEKQ